MDDQGTDAVRGLLVIGPRQQQTIFNLPVPACALSRFVCTHETFNFRHRNINLRLQR